MSKILNRESVFFSPFPYFCWVFYYLLVPFIAFDLAHSDPLLKWVKNYYSKESFDFFYFIDCFLIALFFTLGYFSTRLTSFSSVPKIAIDSKIHAYLFYLLSFLF